MKNDSITSALEELNEYNLQDLCMCLSDIEFNNDRDNLIAKVEKIQDILDNIKSNLENTEYREDR